MPFNMRFPFYFLIKLTTNAHIISHFIAHTLDVGKSSKILYQFLIKCIKIGMYTTMFAVNVGATEVHTFIEMALVRNSFVVLLRGLSSAG